MNSRFDDSDYVALLVINFDGFAIVPEEKTIIRRKFHKWVAGLIVVVSLNIFLEHCYFFKVLKADDLSCSFV